MDMRLLQISLNFQNHTDRDMDMNNFQPKTRDRILNVETESLADLWKKA